MKLHTIILISLLIAILAVAGCTAGPITDGDVSPADEGTGEATPGGALPTVGSTVVTTPKGELPAGDGTPVATPVATPDAAPPRDDYPVVATPGGSAAEEEPTRPVNAGDLLLPPAKPPIKGDVIIGEAAVSYIDVVMMESFPVQVVVTAEGDLPDGCTTISHAEQAIEGNTIKVRLYTARPAEMLCTLALVPYMYNIPLDVLGLPAGDYTVDVNGATGVFNLAVDNTRQ